MSPCRLGPQNFAARRDFEPFCHRFSGFAASDGLGHEARKIVGCRLLTTTFVGT